MADIEKIAADAIAIRSHGQLLTVSAQDLLDIVDWHFGHISELQAEAKEHEEEEKAYQDTQAYMDHHYLSGE